MILYYLDASAWVKRYYAEVGTPSVEHLFSGEHRRPETTASTTWNETGQGWCRSRSATRSSCEEAALRMSLPCEPLTRSIWHPRYRRRRAWPGRSTISSWPLATGNCCELRKRQALRPSTRKDRRNRRRATGPDLWSPAHFSRRAQRVGTSVSTTSRLKFPAQRVDEADEFLRPFRGAWVGVRQQVLPADRAPADEAGLRFQPVSQPSGCVVDGGSAHLLRAAQLS